MSWRVSKQAGLSMVELLIALLISSFLILGVSQVYIDHKRHYMFQQSQMDNLENSRFALLMLDELLAKAGYRRSPEQRMAEAFPERALLTQHCALFPAESVVVPIKPDASNSGQSGFCLRYQPAQQGELICDGKAAVLAQPAPFVPPQHHETVSIAIKFIADKTDADKGKLVCITPMGEMQLLEGIADMNVEFGSGSMSEKRLNSSSPFKAAEGWQAEDGPVRAVRYSILAASRAHQRDGESKVYTQWLAAASPASQARLAEQDKDRIYQLGVGTQALKNMLP